MKRFFGAFVLSIAFIVCPSSVSIAVSENSIVASLASPKGVAAVSMTYALTTGISNFLWAFDWTRAGASNETKAIIQEVGGLTASGESLILGFFIPFWCYQYLQNQPAPAMAGGV